MDKTTQAHRRRQKRNEQYEGFNVEPTEIHGIKTKSRLEALWVQELVDCEHFSCVECFKVPIWIEGPYGAFLSNYKPDLVIENADGMILVELKPTKKLALEDDRQKRAAELNPKIKFVVIGGYPYQNRGVTVKLLVGDRQKVYNKISVCDVLKFLGCECSS